MVSSISALRRHISDAYYGASGTIWKDGCLGIAVLKDLIPKLHPRDSIEYRVREVKVHGQPHLLFQLGGDTIVADVPCTLSRFLPFASQHHIKYELSEQYYQTQFSDVARDFNGTILHGSPATFGTWQLVTLPLDYKFRLKSKSYSFETADSLYMAFYTPTRYSAARRADSEATDIIRCLLPIAMRFSISEPISKEEFADMTKALREQWDKTGRDEDIVDVMQRYGGIECF